MSPLPAILLAVALTACSGPEGGGSSAGTPGDAASPAGGGSPAATVSGEATPAGGEASDSVDPGGTLDFCSSVREVEKVDDPDSVFPRRAVVENLPGLAPADLEDDAQVVADALLPVHDLLDELGIEETRVSLRAEETWDLEPGSLSADDARRLIAAVDALRADQALADALATLGASAFITC